MSPDWPLQRLQPCLHSHSLTLLFLIRDIGHDAEEDARPVVIQQTDVIPMPLF